MSSEEREAPAETEEVAPSTHDEHDDESEDGTESEAEAPVDLMVTTRARRTNAGNRMSTLLAKSAEQEEEWGEEWEDAPNEEEFHGDDVNEQADYNMDSSSSEDEDEGDDDDAGEKELRKAERQDRTKKRKVATNPFAARAAALARKKVKLDLPDAHSPTSAPPRPKKKSERASWLPTEEDGPVRTSSRKQTMANKETTMAKLKEKDRRRDDTLAMMKAAETRKSKTTIEKPLTQAERLAEAARNERINKKTLHRWEEAEEARAAERQAKIDALKNRQIDGPFIRFYSGPAIWVDDKIKYTGKDAPTLQHLEDRLNRDVNAPASQTAQPTAPTQLVPSVPPVQTGQPAQADQSEQPTPEQNHVGTDQTEQKQVRQSSAEQTHVGQNPSEQSQVEQHQTEQNEHGQHQHVENQAELNQVQHNQAEQKQVESASITPSLPSQETPQPLQTSTSFPQASTVPTSLPPQQQTSQQPWTPASQASGGDVFMGSHGMSSFASSSVTIAPVNQDSFLFGIDQYAQNQPSQSSQPDLPPNPFTQASPFQQQYATSHPPLSQFQGSQNSPSVPRFGNSIGLQGLLALPHNQALPAAPAAPPAPPRRRIIKRALRNLLILSNFPDLDAPPISSRARTAASLLKDKDKAALVQLATTLFNWTHADATIFVTAMLTSSALKPTKKNLAAIESALPHPKKELCAVTNEVARYRDPETGIAYHDARAFGVLRGVVGGGFVWSGALGCYVGGRAKPLESMQGSKGFLGMPPAKNVPRRFWEMAEPKKRASPVEGQASGSAQMQTPVAKVNTSLPPSMPTALQQTPTPAPVPTPASAPAPVKMEAVEVTTKPT
ncbi:YL1-domain-containing protein [Pyrenochaeta sp. DS3sAY3a]|nr:YL1-domain-containing protein [Pyrenochaeta sp. DS3sAY3a]